MECRDAGRFCKGLDKHVPFPVCEQETLRKLVSYEEFQRRKKDFQMFEEEKATLAVRGFLRRSRRIPIFVELSAGSREPSSICPESGWEMEMEYLDVDGKCHKFGDQFRLRKGSGLGSRESRLCFGDATIACCSNNIIDSEVEVVASWTSDVDVKFCVFQKIDVQTIGKFYRREKK